MTTDQKISALKTEAALDEDDMLWLTCIIAIEGPIESYEERFGGGGHNVTRAQRESLEAMTQEQAVEECLRVIDNAAAQVD